MADTRPIPLSAAQRRMWVATQTRAADTSYHQPFALRFDGPLDVAALRRAFDALVRRHPPLRARIADVSGVAHFVPDRWPAPEWTVEDVDEAAAAGLAARFGHEPVDLAAGPLTRTRLLRTGPARHWLLVNQHHVASDGRSVEVFTGELLAAYAGCVSGRAPAWTAAPDYPAYWTERNRRDESERDAATRKWAERLAGAPLLADLPTVQPRPVPGDSRRAHHDESLDPELARRVARLARAHRASTYMVLKAALDVVLGGYGPDEVLTGVALHGRDTAGGADLIGFLARPAVLRGDLRGDPTFAELIGRTRADVLDTHELPEPPLDALPAALDLPSDPGHHPLYQVMFSTGRAELPRHAAGVTVRLVFPPLDGMKVDLDVGVTESEHGLDTVFSYRADLFDEPTVAAMAHRFGAVLRAVADDPYRRVDALRRPPVASVAAPFPYAGGLLARFARAAAASPAAVAVRAGGLEWTYDRLRAEVGAVANALRAKGLRPEARVGVCAAPSPELVAALLAVPHAGALAVPVDPMRPRDLLRGRIAGLGLDLLLVDGATEELLTGVDVPLFRVDGLEPCAAVPEYRGAGQADRAVWVTADSAGEPIAMVHTHRAIEAVLARAERSPDAGSPDRSPVGPVDGEQAMWSVLVQLCTGGRVELDDYDDSVVPPGSAPEWADAGTRHVLDEKLRPVPPGAVGQLYVGGAAVARGSLDRPGATAATFVADPYGPAGARMVATGDLVRRYASGRLYRVGRAGECVRHRGVLVSPEPARAALAALPGVARSAVVVTAEGRLLAAVEADPDVVSGLREHLAATLPGFLVPDRVVRLDMIPLLASGAIDRAALPAAIDGSTASAEPSAAEGTVEQVVERAWREVLGRPVEAGRGFFESGGDSIRLIRLRGLLTTELGCPVDVVELFRHPTVRAMAAYLRTLLPEVPEAPQRAEPAPAGPDHAQAGAQRGQARQHARRRLGESRRAGQEVSWTRH